MLMLLLGVLFVLLVRNNFNTEGVKKDIRRIVKAVRQIARDLARTVRQAAREARKESRKAVPEQHSTESELPVPEPARAEAQENNNELLKELKQTARTAAMLANVPTLNFPKDDPKYDSSRKYRYA